MAIAFQTSAPDQTIAGSAGTKIGHGLVSHTGCRYAGAGKGVDIIQLDGTYAEGVRPGASVATFTIDNCTIDVADLPGVTSPLEIGGGIALLIADNVEIRRHTKGSIAVYNRGVFRGSDIDIIGSGGGILHYTGATETTIRGARIHGGQYGFANTAAIGIDLDEMDIRLDYWATPTFEECDVVGYGEDYVDVGSHEESDRSLYDVLVAMNPLGTFTADDPEPMVSGARRWDLVEVGDGRWSQVLHVYADGSLLLDDWRVSQGWSIASTPSTTATIYRLALGRFLGSPSSNRLSTRSGGLPTYAGWHAVEGGVESPSVVDGSKLRIVRHGLAGASAVRDVDTGAIHITETAVNAKVRRVRARGGFSDLITLRGSNTRALDCYAELGQDMCFTVDGTVSRQQLDRCSAFRAGFNGFAVLGGPSDLRGCQADYCGVHGDGYGVSADADAEGSTLDVDGVKNVTALGAASWMPEWDGSRVGSRARHLLRTRRANLRPWQ